MKTAKQVIKQIKEITVEKVGGVHFDREEVAQLRVLVEYLKPSYVGGAAGHALRMLARKVEP